jgi:predicted phosphodiesterase
VKVAVLSDLHANCFALYAVLEELDDERPDVVLLLGDSFGYYPWAVETYRIVRELNPLAILGNHDLLVLQDAPPVPTPSYWPIAKANERALLQSAPEALDWLRSLNASFDIEMSGIRLTGFHGTPDAPFTGRYYPDNTSVPAWFPREKQILLLGHTHYPLVRALPGKGILVNPGSVGQPRDGDLRASWCLLFPERGICQIRRTTYDVSIAVKALAAMEWDRRAVASLQKTHRRRIEMKHTDY